MRNVEKEITRKIHAFIASLETQGLDTGQQSLLLAGSENRSDGAFNGECKDSLNDNCLNRKSCTGSTNHSVCTNSNLCDSAHNKGTCTNGKDKMSHEDKCAAASPTLTSLGYPGLDLQTT